MRKLIATVLAIAVVGAALPSEADAALAQRRGHRAKASAPRRSAPPPAPAKKKAAARKKAASSMTTLPKVTLPDGTIPTGNGGGNARRRASINTSSPSSVNIAPKRPAPKVNYNTDEKPSFKAPQTNTGVNVNAGKKKHGGKRKG